MRLRFGAFLVTAVVLLGFVGAAACADVEQWDIFELTLKGPTGGNPFVDVQLIAEFKQGTEVFKPDGFYDGNGIYKVRFLDKDGSIDKSIYATFLGMIEDAPDPGPLPGQIIVDPDHPEWLKYNGGGPFFMCGPGEPEGFLYRGARNEDGTRDGDQMALINKLKGTGANCIYMQAVRSHGGDGDSTHNPFVSSIPSNGLDQDILNQWETWFDEMDDNGIVIFLFFYDDSARIWTGDTVGSSERSFIQGIVNKFEHHKHLIWCVAEEYSEKYSPARVSNIAAEIRSADEHNHVIAVHQHSGLVFDFPNDANIDQFAMQVGASSASGLHSGCVTAWNRASGKYNVNMSEGTNHISGGSTEIRRKSWAAAMGGAYVMVYEMFIDSTPTSVLKDCGRLVKFMESTEFNKMSPHDYLKHADTDYVLAKPGDCYIAYASGITTSLGIRNLNKGEYKLKWFGCIDGDIDTQTVNIDSPGNYSWNKPSGIGDEVAVYIKKSGGSSGNLSVITSPSPDARFLPGQEVTATGTGDNLSWSINCIGADKIASGTGSRITFTVPKDFTKNNMIRIILSSDGSITEQVHAIASSGTDFCEQNGVVSMEAENYISQEGYNLINRSDASGNLAMQVGSDGSLNFRFTLNSEGTWYIWIRGYATTPENNGLYLKLDGNYLTAPANHPHAGVKDIYLKKHGWCWKPEWQASVHSVHEGPITMTASAGTHILSICKRKTENPVIDKILLTRTDSAPSDSSYGPDETKTTSGMDNIAPIAKDKMVQTGQNESKYIQLLYDDPDSSPGPYTISIVKQPMYGSLSGSGNDLIYVPMKNFSGRDSFEWKVNDGKDDSNVATVTIEVVP